jgi:hypothetical protein
MATFGFQPKAPSMRCSTVTAWSSAAAGPALSLAVRSSGRRVVVISRIVRHQGKRFRSAPLSKHVAYLKREGVSAVRSFLKTPARSGARFRARQTDGATRPLYRP